MKRTNRKYEFIVEKTNTGFSAYCDKAPIFTSGSTITELNDNILEATNLYLEDEDFEVTMKNIDLSIDLKQFFQHYRVLNGKFLAKRIGMNETLLSQYVTGKKKPSRKQVNKIIDGIQEIGRELSELNLISA